MHDFPIKQQPRAWLPIASHSGVHKMVERYLKT